MMTKETSDPYGGRYFKDCKHYEEARLSTYGLKVLPPSCAASFMVEARYCPVAGKARSTDISSCEKYRKKGKPCGPKGKLWEKAE